jgi:glycosyltransferase involved in cell wall biosynthesis
VSESELISAASSADVGVIPYPGPSLNHLYACPNKLSQYLQAGLAILCNEDLMFVSDVVRAQRCGLSYRAREPETLVKAVQRLINDLPALQTMKTRAFQYARTEFNWGVQSEGYKKIIEELCSKGQAIT